MSSASQPPETMIARILRESLGLPANVSDTDVLRITAGTLLRASVELRVAVELFRTAIADTGIIHVLERIATDVANLVEAAPPKFRTWGWRLQTVIYVATAIGAAIAGAVAAWLLKGNPPPGF